MPFSQSQAVQGSPDLDRILALPRRSWTAEQGRLLADQLSDVLCTPGGSWRLFPIQAIALAEIGRGVGAFLPIRVGGGKTLISLLAARMIKCSRPLILLPAALRDKTQVEIQEYRKHFVLPRTIRLFSYEKLSTSTGADYLEKYRPDLLICDEVHALKDLSSARTKRVSRYMKSHGDRCVFVGMSGTPVKRSVKDFSHISAWALRDGTPLPINFFAVDEWARALDSNVNDERRMMPGALSALRGVDPTEPIRRAVGRRIIETPGVVSSADRMLPIKLTIRGHLMQYPSPHWSRLRTAWETPDGWELTDGASVWRHARQLAIGCYYVWDPRPPQDWLSARSAWAAHCREILRNNRRKLDTEADVKSAIDAGHYPDGVLRDWQRIRPTFEPNVRAVWESDHAVDYVQNWISNRAGIVWVSHRFFGVRLQETLGLPYFSAGGVDSVSGRSIEDWDPSEGPIVASIGSNSTGRNLQRWNQNLIMDVPTAGDQWEQLLGRTHRDGQQSDRVLVDVSLGCIEDVESFWRSYSADSPLAEQLFQQDQKLQHSCLTDLPDPASVSGQGPQWTKTTL